MRLVLDAQAFLYASISGWQGRLPKRAVRVIEDRRNVLLLSPLSIAELSIKIRKKQLQLTEKEI